MFRLKEFSHAAAWAILIFGVPLLLIAGMIAPPAHAQSSSNTASGFWNDPYHRSSNDRALDIVVAESQLRAREGGYGPAIVNTTFNGDVTNNTTNNGPVQNSGSTNIVNSNSTSTTVGNGNSGLTLSVSTGQTAGPSNQNAGSQATIIGTGDHGGINQESGE